MVMYCQTFEHEFFISSYAQVTSSVYHLLIIIDPLPYPHLSFFGSRPIFRTDKITKIPFIGFS